MARTPAPNARRSAPVKVRKPFPWGIVAISAVLALFLGGILVYAATNQGAGQNPLATDPDNAIEGVQVTDGELTRNHVAGAVDYPSLPPTGGDHNAAPQQCAVYTDEIAPEHAVHSLEHGAVWITYNDDLADEDVEALTGKASGDPYVLMSPLAEQESPVVLTAWGRQLALDTADDGRVDDFLFAYTSGPQTPERGAACIGNSSTGPVQAALPDGTIQPDDPVVQPPADPSAAPVAPVEPAAPEASPAG